MKQWKKQLSAALCAALLLGGVQMPALAEENEEYDLSDIPGVIIEDPRIDPLEWNFALSLSDLDPELIKLANKECLLSSTYEPSSKTKMLPPAQERCTCSRNARKHWRSCLPARRKQDTSCT